MIECEHVYKQYKNGTNALYDVNFSVKQGEFVYIIGPTGSGKSTLIKILSGVLRPDQGKIKVGDQEYTGLTTRGAIEAGVSTVYQDLALGNTMDVTSNLFLGNEHSRFGFLKKKEMNKKAEELLQNLDIRIPDVTVPVGNLSGGQRQGVAVARLVNRGGKVFIFDEPTKGIDVGAKSEIYDIMRGMADQGKAIIMVSSEMPELLSTCDRIIVFRNGEISGILNNEEATEEKIMYAAVAVD